MLSFHLERPHDSICQRVSLRVVGCITSSSSSYLPYPLDSMPPSSRRLSALVAYPYQGTPKYHSIALSHPQLCLDFVVPVCFAISAAIVASTLAHSARNSIRCASCLRSVVATIASRCSSLSLSSQAAACRYVTAWCTRSKATRSRCKPGGRDVDEMCVSVQCAQEGWRGAAVEEREQPYQGLGSAWGARV